MLTYFFELKDFPIWNLVGLFLKAKFLNPKLAGY